MKLPKSIIKKYGITRKAWQVFKSGSKDIRTHSTKFKQEVKTMARRKRGHRRYSAMRKHYGKSSGVKATSLIVASAGYGAIRSYIANLIAPLTSKIPLGNLADNVGMGVISYYAYKKGSGIVKTAGMAGLAIESAMAGAELMQGGIGGASTSSGNIF